MPQGPCAAHAFYEWRAAPSNMLPPLGQFLEEAIDFVATCPTHDALSFWAERLRSLLQLAEEFAPRQRQLLASCDAHVARINSKKRTLLLKHVLQTVGCQDTAIADELAAGFPLFGWLPESMELPRHPQPPAVDIAFLERMAPALQARALARCQPTDDPAADQTLCNTTLTELQQGWLVGPFLVPDVPSTSVISPRFYVLQSDKCRPIDDFTFNLLNSAVGSANKVVLHDTDFIAALLKRCCSYKKVPWRGRAFDLQDAYRQLTIAPAHRTHSFICHAWPEVLPYADYAIWQLSLGLRLFLQISLAIHALGARLFRLPWTCFYDDFPTVVPKPLANAATHLIKSLFTLLGFQVSDKPSKNPPFAAVFQALGVAFNLTRAVSGVFEVANTEARIHLLASSLQELLTSHSISPKEARRLRGRMQFAHGQLSERYHARCLSSLHELSALAQGSRAVACEDFTALFAVSCQLHSKSRQQQGPPRLAFVYRWCLGGFQALHRRRPRGLLRASPLSLFIRAPGSSSPYNIWISLHFAPRDPSHFGGTSPLPDLLSGTAIFFHVDNEAALHSLIRMSCDNHAADQLVQHFLRLEQRMTFDTWIHRVPTEVNVADAPSRGNETQLLSFQSQKSQLHQASGTAYGASCSCKIYSLLYRFFP